MIFWEWAACTRFINDTPGTDHICDLGVAQCSVAKRNRIFVSILKSDNRIIHFIMQDFTLSISHFHFPSSTGESVLDFDFQYEYKL